MTDHWKSELDAIIAEQADRIVGLRRHLHAHPDPSGEEQATSQHLYQQLMELGLKVRIGREGCGVVADNHQEPKTKRIGFRGDIDALRIQDEKLVDYRSRCDGVMHACGHDAHAAIAFGVALALHEMDQRDALPRPLAWRAVFQPGEETATGARQMIAAGVMEDVSAIYALHVDPTRAVGKIGICSGPFTANCDALDFTIVGQGGHGARPHESKDPIAATAQLINALYQFVPLATDSFDAVVLSIGQISSGRNPNVIPDKAELSGTLRTLSSAVRQRTIEKIREVVRGVGEVTDTQIDVSFGASIPAVYNDPATTKVIESAASEVLGTEGLETITRPSMGSEDFACFVEEAPGSMFRLGTAANLGGITPLHTPRFDIAEDALELGVRILSRAVIMTTLKEQASRTAG